MFFRPHPPHVDPTLPQSEPVRHSQTGSNEGFSVKDKFDILHKLLETHYKSIIDFEFRHATILTVGLGWLITSESARHFFAKNFHIKVIVACSMLVYTIFHAIWIKFSRDMD
jgi:hypothetical protein